MCGIVGMIHPESKGAIDPEILRRMNTSLHHRGPDDEGYYVKNTVGLGMRRLKVIDLEGGSQPISNETGEIWTVFNGEIYNFQILREELGRKGHRLHSLSDTEVIVHLYEEEGEAFVQRLRGMFAIALWDERRRKLLLYRDRLGIKPLHYRFRQGALYFASELKAFLEHPEVSREISLAALGDYLSFLYIPAPRTIYREIQKLPAGHFLRWEKDRIEIVPYWDLSYRVDPGVSEKEWVRRLGAALDESIRMHLVSDVPLGAFLSGGMDSSTIVAWAARHTPSLKTYSIGFPDERYDETSFARAVARYHGTDHHEKRIEADAFELLPRIIGAFDEPFADSSAIPTYLVSEFARTEVTVALSGDGGDELFGGYLWTQKELWLEKYRRLPPGLRRSIESLFLNGDYRPLREGGGFHFLRRLFYDARLSPAESYRRRASSFQPWMKEQLLSPWVREEIRREAPFDAVGFFFEKGSARSVIDKFLYLDSKIYLPDDLLTKVDRMSMIHSLEVRVPFLDHPVVELASAIPASLKMRGSTTKYILKKTMRELLPRVTLRQRKQGFSIPLERWFRGELHDFSKRLLLDPEGRARRFLQRDYVNWLVEEQGAGRQRFGGQLYALVVLELWLRSSDSLSLREIAS